MILACKLSTAMSACACGATRDLLLSIPGTSGISSKPFRRLPGSDGVLIPSIGNHFTLSFPI